MVDFTKGLDSTEYLKPTVRLMKIGDLVITYERHDVMDHIYLEPNQIYQNKFGKTLLTSAVQEHEYFFRCFSSQRFCREAIWE